MTTVPASREPYLQVRSLVKRFGQFRALEDIDLDIHPGEFVSFLGPSGCGKTTLLRAISGLDVQTSGTIRQAGRDISTLPVAKRDFGIVFQSYALFPNLPIRDNVGYGLASAGRPRAEVDRRVGELLDLVGLADQARKYPAQLSGGQQQRVALARALALSPGLLLLDEPLSALDARVRTRLRGEIRDLQRRLGITTIMVTHDQEEALTMSDRIVVMSKGRIEQVGTPDEVYARPATAFVADFVGKMNFLEGRLLAANRADVRGAGLEFADPVALDRGAPVTVCLRPEDVVCRGIEDGQTVNALEMQVGTMEFIGSRFAATLRAPGTGLDLAADFSMNDVRDLKIAEGARLKVALPPDRLRVFAEPPPAAPAAGLRPGEQGTLAAGSAAAVSARPRPLPGRPLRQALARDDLVMRGLLVALLGWLVLTVLLPIAALLVKSFQAADGSFVGLANFAAYFANPSLAGSIGNSLWISLLSTAICVPLAFAFAYGITRTCMPGQGLFKAIAQIPILAPSLLPAISFVYLFGNQGLAKGALLGASVYGPIGIVMGEVFWTFPHALIIVATALAVSDARLYEAAEALRASPWRIFWTVTIPGARYGLISAAFVVFTLVITDFGVPKVIGGQYNVLATDIYKQVVGQQNFQMGAVVGLVLLLPAVLAFAVDRAVQRRQAALLSARAVPYAPKPDPTVDRLFLAICGLVALAILVVLGVAVFASLATYWPYNLTPSLKNYDFDLMDGGGWESYRNSLVMAGFTAVFGTALVFGNAYLIEKTPRFGHVRAFGHLLALLPLAVPGLVLGLGYIFFFNNPANPFHFLYGTMAILVVCTIAHFYSVAHLTAVTALKQIDPEFETVSASLRVPFWRTFARVTLPVCLPAVLDIAIYLFVNAMTTVSAVVFLYAPSTTLAALAVLNMDDAGDVAPAAAMAVLIFLTSAAVRTLYVLAARGYLARAQRWRAR